MYNLHRRNRWDPFTKWFRSTGKSSRYFFSIPLLAANYILPQAPVHTDSLTVYETELQVIATEEGEGNEIRRPVVRASEVIEQRISHFMMGLGIIGTMTGPLLVVLHTIPRAIFCGVFFVVGVSVVSSLFQSAFLTIHSNIVGIHREQWHHAETYLPS